MLEFQKINKLFSDFVWFFFKGQYGNKDSPIIFVFLNTFEV